MNLTKPQMLVYNMEKVSGGAISTICGRVLTKGTVDEEKIKEVINRLFEKNDSFRLRFFEQNGEVSQEVFPFTEKEIEVLHFESAEQLDKFCSKTAKEPIDLHGELAEIKGIVVGDEYGFIVKAHHGVSDGWALSLLVSQFVSLMNGEEIETHSYLDYIETEKKYLESKRFEKDEKYWGGILAKCDEPVFLSEKTAETNKAESVTFTIGKEQTALISSFAKDTGNSIYNILMTAVCVFFSKVKNNAEKFFIGTASLNRSNNAEKNTMGMFVNTVPILIELNNNESFEKNIEAVSGESMTAFRHQRYNYSDILKLFHQKHVFGDKLYDVLFSYQNAKIGEKQDLSTVWFGSGIQNESLQIHVDGRDCDGTLNIKYDFQTEKYIFKDIEEIHDCILSLLFDAIDDYNQKVAVQTVKKPLFELNILSSKQQHILSDFSQGEKAERTKTNTVCSLFEKQIHGRENEICIETAKDKVTFKKFEALISALDGEIRKFTLGKKQIVAVLCERSIEMYLSIYAAVRGGNAYLPISPDFPKERIEYILKDSGACLLLAQGRFKDLVKDTVPVLDVSEFLSDESSLNGEVLPCEAKAEDTAYVIYTSGSTGAPKGAKISHRSAVNRILWMQKKYPLEKDSVILQKTPYTFDVSVWEHFWWGMCDGRLAVSNPNEHFLPAKILADCKKYKVTHLHFVPSVFKLFLDYLENHKEDISDFASVRYVFLSGEALESELIKRFYALFDREKVKLANLYGPTECAVDVTYYDCLGTETDPVPIGKPIDNTSIYILDRYKKPVPLGVKGEIYIGGENVGQGYLNNEKLTEEKFIQNPFGDGKIYKTGDYGFIRDDGQIVFCGRIDNQIKLGGQRIELGEIENAILSIDGITSCAVLLKKDSVHDYLAAFYFGQKQDESLITDKLNASLPKYMVPKLIVFKENMSLNPSGKLDRKALEKIEIEISNEEDTLDEPINESERRICKAFGEVLKTEKVGRNSDFTLLGGTSLDIIKLLSKDEFTFLEAHDIIANPTPRTLAVFMSKKAESKFKYLHKLSNSNAKKSLIIFPFAGGSANSFLAFSEKIKKSETAVNLYFCDYLHSFEDCKKLSEEIIELSKTSEIYFYSHCVGSSVAMQTIAVLEKENKHIVKHFISAASIPQKTPFGRNIWDFVSDKMLGKILVSAGSKLDHLSKESQNKLLKDFRRDTDFSSEFLHSFKDKINCPVTVIISPDDIFTKNYKSAKHCWEKYTDNLKAVLLINSKSHYFQTDNAFEFAKMIENIIR